MGLLLHNIRISRDILAVAGRNLYTSQRGTG